MNLGEKMMVAVVAVPLFAAIAVPSLRPWNWKKEPLEVESATRAKIQAAPTKAKAIAVVEKVVLDAASDKASVKHDFTQAVSLGKDWLVQTSYVADGKEHHFVEYEISKDEGVVKRVTEYEKRPVK